ncbi:MAG TPA: energy transducer TonB [Gemmatimonadaceae bacterium]|jgi:outer membrane biosynthesis protein TonB|nr:energy transducer TonB [Gemmatimonadaceae bacterium]
MARKRAEASSLGKSLGVSALVHGGALATLLIFGARGNQIQAPIYRVELIAAPRGDRAIGVVDPVQTPTAETPKVTTPPPTEVPVIAKERPAPRRTPTRATPTPAAQSKQRSAAAPKAGGGPEGGAGTDVTNVRTEGMNFPFPEYLNNVVRQIQLRFKPRGAGNLVTEVVFFIRRDGSVQDLQIQKRSGSLAFDLEAQGAVEAVSAARAFGPLPAGWGDDVLKVIFTFEPGLVNR